MSGYRCALEDGAHVVVKLDGDGQMNPRLIPLFVKPILDGESDYTKGNRFYHPSDLFGMPPVRIFGNALLSFMTKLSSGYWDIFDPTNGYTAIQTSVLRCLPLDKIDSRYFFESDMLFRLNTIRAVVLDIPMEAVYGDEQSGLSVLRVIPRFLYGHARNLLKRIGYNYFLRDFQIASLELIAGVALLSFGLVFGLTHWIQGIESNQPTGAGTVMLAALPVLAGLQLLLAAVNYDIQMVPRTVMHRRMPGIGEAARSDRA